MWQPSHDLYIINEFIGDANSQVNGFFMSLILSIMGLRIAFLPLGIMPNPMG